MIQALAALAALVNNAGVAVNGPVEVVGLDDWRRQLEVGVFAQIGVTQALLPAPFRPSSPSGHRHRRPNLGAAMAEGSSSQSPPPRAGRRPSEHCARGVDPFARPGLP